MTRLLFIVAFTAVLGTAICFTKPNCNDEFRTIILTEHNKLRKKHLADPLRMNEQVCIGAQREVERKMTIFIHNETIAPNQESRATRNYNDHTWTLVNYGNSSWNAKRVIDDWINQGKLHDFNENYFDTKTGHFTQMVWRTTEDIGIGYTRGRTKLKQFIQMVLIRYTPPGNILDKEIFADNVLPEQPLPPPAPAQNVAV